LQKKIVIFSFHYIKKVCWSAHPYFDPEEGFLLPQEEIKLLALLWRAVPLAPEKLHVQRFDKTLVSPIAFIDSCIEK
jgi:hypothetical protein